MLKIQADKIKIDGRLKEIDYGDWEGQSNEAIKAIGGSAALNAWAEDHVFPASANWSPSPSEIVRNVAAFLSEMTRGTSLVITSNGILRFFAHAAINAEDYRNAKVATGHMCVITGFERSWTVEQWNKAPSELRL